MKNVLAYYYNLYPEELINKNGNYFFNYNNNYYSFEIYSKPITDLDYLYNLNKNMLSNNLLVHIIILNNDNKIITYVNNEAYILLEIQSNYKTLINLPEICYINNNTNNIKIDNVLLRNDWVNLWEIKNDYFEGQINEIGLKYPILSKYVNYYIGLAENAISYLKNALNIKDDSIISVSHRRVDFNSSYYELYHPLNFIFDYRIRDLCEYIKSAFFNDQSAYDILHEYFNHNFLSFKEASLFYSRLLYPSYFFDLYDEIVNNVTKENKIEEILKKQSEYEMFLVYVNRFLSRLYNRYLPQLDWLIKKSY